MKCKQCKLKQFILFGDSICYTCRGKNRDKYPLQENIDSVSKIVKEYNSKIKSN